MLNWPDLTIPPINLYNCPYTRSNDKMNITLGKLYTNEESFMPYKKVIYNGVETDYSISMEVLHDIRLLKRSELVNMLKNEWSSILEEDIKAFVDEIYEN